MKRLLTRIIPLLALCLLFSCSDNGTGPDNDTGSDDNGSNNSGSTTGTVEVTTSTSGEDQDSDGYTLTLGDNEKSISVNETITFEEVEEDSYDAELTGISSNCSVDGNNPRSLDVTAGETTSTTFEVSCEAVEEGSLAISSVTPQEGTVDEEVKIRGSNFGYTQQDLNVTFNGTEAIVDKAWDDSLLTIVPEGATDGPIEVTLGEQTATGPDFNVIPAPNISSVSPEEGEVGTEVTITGTNFRTTASENIVKFGEVGAPVNSVTSTEIVTEVPEGAGDGISVTVGQQTASIDFAVLQLGKLEVATTISGSEQDFNGYKLVVRKDPL